MREGKEGRRRSPRSNRLFVRVTKAETGGTEGYERGDNVCQR